MRRTGLGEPAQNDGREGVPARLARCLGAPFVVIVAPSGAGKSTLVRQLDDPAGSTEIIRLARAMQDPSGLDYAIDHAAVGFATAGAATTLVIDDAHIVTGTRAESVLAGVTQRCDAEHHLVLASRIPLGAELTSAGLSEPDLVGAPELALRIDEVAALFRDVGGHPLPLETASHVVTETCGWAGLVHDLAVRTRLVEAESLEAAVSVALRGDFAAPRLERALRALPPEVVRSLELTCDLPTLDFGECVRRLGADAAATLVEAVDGGAVMHTRSLGSRALPPLLRRHLCARAGLDPAALALPSRPVAPVPGVPAGRGPDAFDDAMAHLRRGDVVGAVPLLHRMLRAPADDARRAWAHLALLVIREPLAPRESTLDALAALERECVALGHDAVARVTRGAVAAVGDLTERIGAQVITECDVRGDAVGAALTAGVQLVVRARHGRATSVHARALTSRLERLGLTDAAAWACAAEAVLEGAADGSDAPRRIIDAETASIATGIVAIRALVDAARALSTPAADRAGLQASARRHARQAGFPRLPPALVRLDRSGDPGPAPITARRQPHLTVGCFGGFRLCADGVEIDLRTVRPQARALLRMLALNAGAPVHRELIADILWGDLGIDSAVHALHVSVSSLRHSLRSNAPPTAASIVERVGDAYRLGVADRQDCDLADFDDRLAEAAAAKVRHDPNGAADGLRRALARYIGDVLPEDGPAEWVTGARERYRLRAAEAASSLAHLELHLGDGRAAVAAASRAVEIDPWLDESWRTLVVMQRRSGDVVAAARTEEGYRNMRIALGVE